MDWGLAKLCADREDAPIVRAGTGATDGPRRSQARSSGRRPTWLRSRPGGLVDRAADIFGLGALLSTAPRRGAESADRREPEPPGPRHRPNSKRSPHAPERRSLRRYATRSSWRTNCARSSTSAWSRPTAVARSRGS